jgi:shikimate dehydrogenase
MKKVFGLLGRNISYSFSRSYFSDKFRLLDLPDFKYENFDLERIEDFDSVVMSRIEEIGGLNVTIPYKEKIIGYIDELDPVAERIGAVNTIKILPGGRLKGYNTDAYGFQFSLSKRLGPTHTGALILGTGGASKAVAFVFEKLGLQFRFVSRSDSGDARLSYSQLNEQVVKNHQVIVNCTPLGTFPRVEEKPDIPYEFIGSGHLLFDLIYNPEKTAFLIEGEKRGAKIVNGSEMLRKQADRAWEIWNS